MKYHSQVSSLLLTLILSSAHYALAEETFVSVFLDGRPVQGLNVSVDAELTGVTAEDGSLALAVESGSHSLLLFREDILLSQYDYDLADGENAEIAISFSENLATPKVKIEKYRNGDPVTATGILQGSAISFINGSGVAGATVKLLGTELAALTDADGIFRIEAPRGTYNLVVTHPNFESFAQDNFRIVANSGLYANVTLRPSATDDYASAPDANPAVVTPMAAHNGVEEMFIVGRFQAMNSAVDMERLSGSIIDAVDAEQLSRFGDSNVAGALKRIAGVSVNDGKYAVVRGLDGRYISSTLNNNLMPTTDPLRRDVQLDLFPANILGNIEISKSYSADLPGDSTGGTIAMNTKDAPTEYSNKLSLGLGYNFDITGSDIVGYEGSGTDWLTYDNGDRKIPGEVATTFTPYQGTATAAVNTCDVSGCDISYDENARLAQQFPVVYNTSMESASPDFSLGYALGNSFDNSFGEVGVYGAVGLGNSTKSRIDASFNDSQREGTYERSVKSSKLNAYFVVGLDDNHDGSWLSKTIFLRQADDTTRVVDGYNYQDGVAYKEAMLRWNEREFFAQQFSGSHPLFEASEFSWRMGASKTTMDEPDRRSWYYSGGVFLPSSAERRYSALTEDGTDFGVDYKVNFDLTENITTELKVGALYNKRDRVWNSGRFSFNYGRGPGFDDTHADVETQLSQQNLADKNFQLRKTTANTDSFTADIETTAFYLTTETLIADKLTLVLGARQEDNTQTLNYPYENSVNNFNELDGGDLLPSLTLAYDFNDSWKLRSSYSQTVSRPGVIERSSSSMSDPDTDKRIFGNPDLVVATIDNLDLRLEYYFENGGNASLAWFSKTIDNPIEKTLPDASGSASNGYEFRNAASADISGIELDFSKQLVDSASWSVDLGFNLSLIDSKVSLDSQSLRLEGTDAEGRELQGQSPFLVNFQLAADHLNSGQEFTLLLNHFDDKIDAVGRGAGVSNEMELGRTSLDFNYKWTLESESSISVKLSNILDASVEYEQNGTISESYKEGRSLSVGYTHSFWFYVIVAF